MTTMPAAPAAPADDAWLLRTRSDQLIYVPGRMSSLTTYVMLEQEQWFETEIGFVARLLEPGTDVLDIGANHGVYTLALAQGLAGDARVFAFEPAAEPRARLARTLQANGLDARVTLVPCALSDHAGQARLHTSAQSELNSLHGAGGAGHEDVELQTLDAFAARCMGGRTAGFVKIDAEGEEMRVLRGGSSWFAASPAVVMFELVHGARPQPELVAAFQALGYGVFRHLPGLDLLLEVDPADGAPNDWVLNLFAVKPAQQERLAAGGLLVRSAALAGAPVPEPHRQALQRLAECPPLRGLALPQDGDSPAYAAALARAATAQLGLAASAAERVQLLLAARDGVQQALNAGQLSDIAAWTLLVHCLYALGQRNAALAMAAELLKHWPAQAVQRTVFMPLLASELQRPRSSDAASWMRQTLAEFIEMRRSHSSFFVPSVAGSFEPLLQHPDHSVEMERRYLLAELRGDRLPQAGLLRRLRDAGASRNAAIWAAWLEQLRGEHHPASALDLLLPLIDRPLTVVDVGASEHGGTVPYASLLASGQARVTGFEPDAQALATLHRLHPEGGQHRFLPHFVGDGGPARFHHTTWFMTSSLLPPDPAVMDAYQHLGDITREVSASDVQTVRLDDVVAAGGMDLLKIDVQGAEGQVFDGAAQRLRECLMVWTEVEFAALYRGQPLFGDIDRRLAAAGLRFFCFTGFGQRLLAGWPQRQPQPGERVQQLWADAIYVPTPERMAAMDAGSLARLAVLCHEVLVAPDLCHAALQQLERRSGGSGVAARYMEAVLAA